MHKIHRNTAICVTNGTGRSLFIMTHCQYKQVAKHCKQIQKIRKLLNLSFCLDHDNPAWQNAAQRPPLFLQMGTGAVAVPGRKSRALCAAPGVTAAATPAAAGSYQSSPVLLLLSNLGQAGGNTPEVFRSSQKLIYSLY